MKEVRNCYPSHHCFLPRAWTDAASTVTTVAHFNAARIRWHDPPASFGVQKRFGMEIEGEPPQNAVGLPCASRAGRTEWRVASIHYNNVMAKKKGSVRYALGEFFRLMIRDRIDMVGGDWNGANCLLREVLTAVCPSGVKFRVLQPPEAPEVALVLFLYPGAPFYDAEVQPFMDRRSFTSLNERARGMCDPLVVYVSAARRGVPCTVLGGVGRL